MRILKFAVAALGALALTLPSTMAVAAQKKAQGAYGKPQGHAKSSVNRQKPGGGGGQKGGGQHHAGNRPGGQQGNRPNQQGNYNKGKKKGGNNVVAGNTVVVNGGGGRGHAGNGYYDNGRYHDNDWDNDDNDFLEFVGKTAAITAGVSVVTAVIGSVSNEKPDGCQPVNANGTSYMYCNGTYYQQSGPTSQPTYTVVAPPQ